MPLSQMMQELFFKALAKWLANPANQLRAEGWIEGQIENIVTASENAAADPVA